MDGMQVWCLPASKNRREERASLDQQHWTKCLMHSDNIFSPSTVAHAHIFWGGSNYRNRSAKIALGMHPKPCECTQLLHSGFPWLSDAALDFILQSESSTTHAL